MTHFSKVLFINGEPFSKNSATGITVSNLFDGWPKDSIAQIYTANIPTDATQFAFSSRLTSRNLLPTIIGSSHPTKSINSTNVSTRGSSMRGLREKLQYACAPALDFFPYRPSPSLLQQIEEFKPDVIYSLLGNIRITKLVFDLSRRFRVPAVPHFMDDWLSTYAVPDKSTGTWLHRLVLNATVLRLFEQVPIGMAIGDMMAQEYSQRFHREFLPFMNPIESVAERKIISHTTKNPLVFVYVGGLHLRRNDALADLADVLSDINQMGIISELHIYAPDEDGAKARQLAAQFDTVRYCGNVPPHMVAEILSQSDVAVHVESSEASVSQYTRFSVSTKIPQYFAAGLPVLSYGPTASASSAYIVDSKAGVSVDGGDKKALKSEIHRLVADREWRDEIGASALKVAIERHLGAKVRAAFANTLARAASAGVRAYA